MQNVKLIVLDVDGTLTDGMLQYDELGGEAKSFHVADGLGIAMAQAVGFKIAVLSGRRGAATERRMTELKVGDIIQGASDKAAALRTLMAKHTLTPEQVAYVGDDINDIPAFDMVGVRIAVADAADFLKQRADWVTPRAGGQGAVRDAIEEILRRQGRLAEAINAYLAQSYDTGAARQ